MGPMLMVVRCSPRRAHSSSPLNKFGSFAMMNVMDYSTEAKRSPRLVCYPLRFGRWNTLGSVFGDAQVSLVHGLYILETVNRITLNTRGPGYVVTWAAILNSLVGSLSIHCRVSKLDKAPHFKGLNHSRLPLDVPPMSIAKNALSRCEEGRDLHRLTRTLLPTVTIGWTIEVPQFPDEGIFHDGYNPETKYINNEK